MAMAQVRLEAISRSFEKLIVLENISFIVPEGEFWVLVGPSGCGKSTLLRIIAGLETPTQGKIYLNENLVNQVAARDRDVAMVFQNYALYPHMSVAENLAFGLKMRQVEGKKIEQRVKEVANSLNIEHLLKRKPKQLSGGQQQRVALGRAIARQPQVFLLDEPLSNLDTQLRDDTRAELKQLHQKWGITTIYVTHDQIEAMTLADRIVVLNNGKIQQIGKPQEIYSQPINRMVAQFLGNPPMNVFPVTYTEQKWAVAQQFLAVSPQLQETLKPYEGQVFALGIRGEDISLAKENNLNNNLLVKVEIIEPLGREILIRGSLPGTNLTINFIFPGSWQGISGDLLTVELDLKRVFIFDLANGETLYSEKT